MEYRTYTCDIEQAREAFQKCGERFIDWMNGNNLQTTAYEELESVRAGDSLVGNRSPSLQAFHDAVFEDKWPIFRLSLCWSPLKTRVGACSMTSGRAFWMGWPRLCAQKLPASEHPTDFEELNEVL